MRIFKIICVVFISVGFLILAVNLVGISYNPYSPKDYQYIGRGNDTSITYECSLNNIKYENYRHKKFLRANGPHSENMQNIEVIVNIVFERMSNLLSKEGCGVNLFRISLFDNWILWIKSNFTDPDLRYEFANPYRALKTGAGFCSQQSMVVAELLIDYGWQAGIMPLKGHVVSWVKTKKGKIILDPDYGVILPFNFEYACINKELLVEYYKNMKLQMLTKEATINEAKRVADIYCKNKGRDFKYKEGVDGYFGKGYKNHEEKLYYLKWLIPGIMILFSVIGYIFISNVTKKKFKVKPSL